MSRNDMILARLFSALLAVCWSFPAESRARVSRYHAPAGRVHEALPWRSEGPCRVLSAPKGEDMPRFSACIEMIFRDLPVPARIAAVAAAGLPAFEFWDWRNKDLDAMVEAQRRHGLAVSAFSGVGGQRLPLVDVESRDRVVEAVRESCGVATRLGCATLICTAGNELPDRPRRAQHDAVVANLRAAAPIAADHGVTLVLEPLNVLVNHAGYYLVSSAEGFEIVGEVGSPHVKLLYDVYHQQISEGYLTQTIAGHTPQIGHIHVADSPGRHEPGTGEINYRHIFKVIDAAGHAGYVGLEYHPSGDAGASLRQTLALAEALS